MRHRVAGRGLGRSSSHRKALIRNQITELLRHDRIVTTEAKAKSVRPAAEKVITLGKRGSLHARRQADAILTDKKVLKRLFDDIAPRFGERRGGYTRIVKLGPRQGDGAHMALIELVDGPIAVPQAAPAVAEEAVAEEAAATDESPAAQLADTDDAATDDSADDEASVDEAATETAADIDAPDADGSDTEDAQGEDETEAADDSAEAEASVAEDDSAADEAVDNDADEGKADKEEG